jgi:hypothetical protein
MRGKGSSTKGDTERTLEAYTTVVHRALEGFPVPDSVAWATVNADARVVAEEVFWPPIPQTVIDDAKMLNQSLTDPVRRSELETRLPAGSRTVAIRHSSWTEQNFVAFAAIDVLLSSRGGGTLHFDRDGKPLRLPRETEATVTSVRR